MDRYFPPQSPPPNDYRRIWIVVASVFAFCFIVFVAFAVGAGLYLRNQAAKRAAIAELEQTRVAARQQMEETMRSGDFTDADVPVKRMKDTLNEIAAHSSGSDAGVSRAMANYLGKVQTHVKAYSESVAKLQQANVMAFTISDRATIEEHRAIVREFLARNERSPGSWRTAKN